jgi:HPt (histidine-containing phosphotransfer) domain-containing protein
MSALPSRSFRHIDPNALGLSASGAAGKLAYMFLDIGPQQWSAVEEAWQQGAPKSLARSLHTLRGSLVIFGAHTAVELATVLEHACAGGMPDGLAAQFDALRDEFERVSAEMAEYAADFPQEGDALH